MTVTISFTGKVGAQPQYHHLVRGYLNQHLPQRWIGRTTAEDQALLC
jgi:hypothetical protein